MIFYIIVLLMTLKLTKCSTVLDQFSQNIIYVSTYCPKMKYCREGTHVMCVHYDHDHLMGPQCRNYVEVKMTPGMVQQILQTVNEIRSNLALGKEIGKNGQLLPRAYGMMRMEWDSELATLAQVLANQCLGLEEDFCRATEKFPNPSQIITLVNFKLPDWQYFSRNTTVRGLTQEKLAFSIDKALRSLHAVRRTMTAQTINYCPVLETLPDMGSRSYLKLIHAKATHIGCGISAYTRYHASDNNAQNIYNSVQIVCNISEGPQPSQPLYATDAPIPETGYSDICGCPSGYREVKDCLCEVNPFYTTSKNIGRMMIGQRPLQTMKTPTTKKIATEHCDQKTGKCEPEVVFLPIFEIQDAPTYSEEVGSDNENALQRRFNKSYVRSGSMEDVDVSEEKYKELLDVPKINPKNNLPSRFSSSHHDVKPEFRDHDNTDEVKFDTDFDSADDSLIGNNQYSRKNNDYDDTLNVNDVYKETDNSFMSLLNVLERAVQNIELDGEEKEIFDIKMRKIYETVINTNKLQDFASEPAQIENDFLELKNYLKHKSRLKIEGYEPDDWPKKTRKSNIQGGEKDMNLLNNYNYIDPKDSDVFEQQNNGIDDRLIDILSKKGYESQLDRKYQSEPIFKNSDSDLYNIDRPYDKSFDYTHTPAPRKQETIVKYHKDLKTTKAPQKVEYKNVITKNLNNDRRVPKKYYYQNMNNEKNNKNKANAKSRQTFNVKPIKSIGRRTFTYSGKNTGKIHENPAYRRIFETEHARPIRPMRPNHGASSKKAENEPDRFYISDRATY